MSENSHNCRPVIFGFEGLSLTEAEGAFFHEARPWGVILFARNIESREQLRDLTDQLREMSGNRHLPILIDQEGGRVARLRPPLVAAYPPMGLYGDLYQQDRARAVEAARLGAALMAQDLFELGITITCAPCLDLQLPQTNDVIGDRAFGEDVETVVTLGRAVLDGLEMGGVLPVVKHIPGHGRATVDSHFDLPVIEADVPTLQDTDFAVFRQLNAAPMAMTGHLKYTSIDAAQVSTLSKPVIEGVVREHIGFDGLLMTDDVSMKALSGDIGQSVKQSLAAGCDVVLHCNGDRAEMQTVFEALPDAPSEAASRRLHQVDASIADLQCSVPQGARKVWGELVRDIFPDAQNAL